MPKTSVREAETGGLRCSMASQFSQSMRSVKVGNYRRYHWWSPRAGVPTPTRKHVRSHNNTHTNLCIHTATHTNTYNLWVKYSLFKHIWKKVINRNKQLPLLNTYLSIFNVVVYVHMSKRQRLHLVRRKCTLPTSFQESPFTPSGNIRETTPRGGARSQWLGFYLVLTSY